MRSLLVCLLIFAPHGFGQPAAPAFELESVKVAVDPAPYHWDMSPGALRLRGMNLKQCILTAYQVQDFQVDGGPGWTDSERYDIDAKAASPAERDELLLMLRTLLKERFHLTLQTKSRSTLGYAMTVSKRGLKITPDTSEGRPAIKVNRNSMTVTRFPMVGLAGALSNILAIPVSDTTGLPGWFSFHLEWTPEDNRMSPSAPDRVVISLPEALEQNVGLRLERGKISVPVYVIEHAEKPSAN
jgi:uncharacterized protein (TIGR03435 family)